MTALASTAGRRGGPLVMLALVLTAWTGARALWWENPFARTGDAPAVPMTTALVPSRSANRVIAPWVQARTLAPAFSASAATRPAVALPSGRGRAAPGGIQPPSPTAPNFAAAQPFSGIAARPGPVPLTPATGGAAVPAHPVPQPPPYLPPSPPLRAADGRRWSLDAWAFWRQGSDAAPISQGRVPIYGANQAGAVLQYRLAPGARRDPLVYARAYRALVRRGERELALGASARPVGQMPVRVAAEMRYTDAAFTNQVRPSAYVVTELAPIRLPYDAQLEAYAQAGWVGGASATAFADGQVSVTGEMHAVAGATGDRLRLSLGAAAWGGAQTGAQRLDLGPTIRLDLTVGEVPARLSFDWRERVGGKASPGSGLAATLSTRF